MLYALEEALVKAATDESAKVIILRGAGDRSFSTGANLNEFRNLGDGEIPQWIADGHRIFNRLENLPKPTVALIDGYAMGGGLELALCCDFRIGTENTLLSSPELKNGWLPGWGGIARLRRLIGEPNAKRIVLLSEAMTAEEALKIGLLTKIIPSKDISSQFKEFVKPLLHQDMRMYGLAKSALMQTRSTDGTDVHFDIMAAQIAKSKNTA